MPSPTADQEAIAAAEQGTGPRCGVKFRSRAGHNYVCIRPPHGGQWVHQDKMRRQRGESVSADKHYFVREGT